MSRGINNMIATIVNIEKRKNRDSENDQRMLSCEIEADDVQSIELVNVSGEDNNPLDGDTVLVINISDAYKLGLLIDDGVSPDDSIGRGERLLYSRDSGGAVKAKVALKSDGSLILNSGSDFAVAFNKLKVEFEELKNKFNLHTHPGVSPGSSSTATTLDQSLANIDNAKVEKVKL